MTGGSLRGEPFDIEDAINLPERLHNFRIARRLFGDDWVKKNLNVDPALEEARLAEKQKKAISMLRKLAIT